jgi:L-ascorbate metabolism protein UlaG (beta-lactamase superfamily)
MKITKYGHCCLLIEEEGLTILTDPGSYNTFPVDLSSIDVVLLTHEHGDHVHIDHLKKILKQNKSPIIYTHKGVGRLLDEEEIVYTEIKDSEIVFEEGVSIQSMGSEHACIHPGLPPVQNTGFFINKKLFYPGDAFYIPKTAVEILALPVSGPWMKLEEAIEYAKEVNPKKVFPVHDGMLRQGIELGPTRRIPKAILEPLGIEYIDLTENSSIEV